MARQDNSFKVKKGLINLESGIHNFTDDNTIYLNVLPGILRLIFDDATTEDLDVPTGMALSFEWATNSRVRGVKTVEIISGKFHIGL